MNLSENFTLAEFTYSSVAEKKGIDNTITDPDIVLPNARALCKNVLQKVRDHFGPIIISSGYSNAQLAMALGRKTFSQHCVGEAADIVSKYFSSYEIACWIKENCIFDQLIYECRKRYRSDIRYDWVHVSFKKSGGNRKEVLYSPPSKQFIRGLPEKSLV